MRAMLGAYCGEPALYHGAHDGGENHLHGIEGQEGDTAQHKEFSKREAAVEIAVEDEGHVGKSHSVEEGETCEAGQRHAAGRGVLTGYAPNEIGGGDEAQEEAEGGLQHIAKAAAHGEDGQAQQPQRHVDGLAHRAPFSAQYRARHGGDEELRRHRHYA